MAIATANSKKFEAPTSDAGAAIFCGNLIAFEPRYPIPNIKNIWIIYGIAINIISNGLFNIRFPCDEKININVNNKPIVVILSNFGINLFSKYSLLL
nr:hypothetical protein [uncultured Methanosphaera sp.]